LENERDLSEGVFEPYPTSQVAAVVIVEDRGGFDEDSKILIVEGLDQGSKRNGEIGLIVIPVLARMVMIKETQA
jgi:hypothetical protein